MGVRPSKHFVIVKKDLESKMVVKRTHQNIIEYWIYKPKESTLILTKEAKQSMPRELSSIIICANDHIKCKNAEGAITIEGVKFTNDITGNNLQEYLIKTGRND